MIISDIKGFISFLRPSNIKAWFNVENLFINYFWLYTVSALIKLLFDKDWLVTIIFPLIIFTLFIRKVKPKDFNIIDLFWLLEFVWVILTWVLNNYPYKYSLIIKCISQEMMFMLAYWISRNVKTDYLRLIIKSAYKPLVITCVIGIYCFFFEPAWYANRTAELAYDIMGGERDKESLLELYRLKSIFATTYSLAYFCAITLIYEFFFIFSLNKLDKKRKRYRILFIFLLIITSVLCMMRAPIAGALFGLGVSYIYSIKYIKGIHPTRSILLGISGICLLILISLPFIDLSLLDFMLSKVAVFSNKDDSFIESRLFLQMQSLSWLGEGFGKFSPVAKAYDMPIIPDGEYMKIIAEQGFLGLGIILLIFGSGIVKALKNFEDLHFEFVILCFLLICMIGADPLSIFDKHCFLYWLALGQISKYRRKRKENESMRQRYER